MKKNNFGDLFAEYDIFFDGVRVPKYEISYKGHEGSDTYGFLRFLCLEGFKKLNLPKDSKDYKVYASRVKLELETLKELDFVDYMLLVWDVIDYCKRNNIAVGAGRGSAAGSLVLFLIGVTRVDPVKNDLYFERFISKTRAKKKVIDGIIYLDGNLMCDVDLDIDYYNRHKVIEYLEKKYPGRTCKIGTLNTLQGKLLIKECGKIVYDLSEDEVKYAAALIPEMYGKVRDIETTKEGELKEDGSVNYEKVGKFSDWCDKYPEAYQTALKLRELIKNKSVHASALIISNDDLEKSLPVVLSPSKTNVSAWDMRWTSLISLKLDLLGLRAVSVVDEVCKQIGVKMEDLDVNDPIIYQSLENLKAPHGLFQIEADTVYSACKKIKPKNIDELSCLLALARPGAMQFIDQYATYTNSGVYQSIHPFFDDILGKTGGICAYQEQLLKMANKIGFSLEEAETLRRVIGKKKVEEMKEWEKRVYDKCRDNKLDEEIGKILWRIMDDSKNYSFNKSHSFCYAVLAANTIYLKFKYPQQFFLALLKMTKHEPDHIGEISKIYPELSYFNINLLPPDIIKSDLDFSLEGKDIRFGLLSIKGISDKSIEKLTKFRNKYSNKFEIFQAAEEAKIGIGILSALIQAGALSGYSQARCKIVSEAQLWSLLTVKEKRCVLEKASEFDYDLIKIIKHLEVTPEGSKGKPVIKDTRMATIRKRYDKYFLIYQQNKKDESFTNWYYEKTLLGHSYYTTLKDIFTNLPVNPEKNLERIREINDLDENESVEFVGWIKETMTGTSRNKNKYFKAVIQDETASISVLMFDTERSKSIEECKDLNGRMPKEDNIVIVKGVRKGDAVFANHMSIQDQKVYTKLKELSREEKSDENVDNTPKIG